MSPRPRGVAASSRRAPGTRRRRSASAVEPTMTSRSCLNVKPIAPPTTREPPRVLREADAADVARAARAGSRPARSRRAPRRARAARGARRGTGARRLRRPRDRSIAPARRLPGPTAGAARRCRDPTSRVHPGEADGQLRGARPRDVAVRARCPAGGDDRSARRPSAERPSRSGSGRRQSGSETEGTETHEQPPFARRITHAPRRFANACRMTSADRPRGRPGVTPRDAGRHRAGELRAAACVDIAPDLRDQRIDRVELLLVTQPRHERRSHPAIVEIPVEVEDVDLEDQAAALDERRVGARGSRPPAAAGRLRR